MFVKMHYDRETIKLKNASRHLYQSFAGPAQRHCRFSLAQSGLQGYGPPPDARPKKLEFAQCRLGIDILPGVTNPLPIRELTSTRHVLSARVNRRRGVKRWPPASF
jgi:hypothetical protein